MNKTDSKEDTKFRILRVLHEQPHITQREIASHIGISLGGVNYCLRALANKGMVEIKNFRNSNSKVGYAYMLTPKGIAEKTALTTQFLKRKTEEYKVLKAEIETLKEEISKMPDSQPFGEEF